MLADDLETDLVSHYIIKPVGYNIPKSASDIHGITTKQALEEGHDLETVLLKFMEHLSMAEGLVAHNLAFDIKVLETALMRCHIPAILPRKQVCTMQLSTRLVKLPAKNGKGYKWPKLSELHTFLFDVDFDNAHSSDADTFACAKCFFELQNRGLV
jgi:DNA polymerase III epsilon subunit-like protein